MVFDAQTAKFSNENESVRAQNYVMDSFAGNIAVNESIQ